MKKLNRDNFWNKVEGGAPIGENMMSGDIMEFDSGKAIAEIAEKVDEIIEFLNNNHV